MVFTFAVVFVLYSPRCVLLPAAVHRAPRTFGHEFLPSFPPNYLPQNVFLSQAATEKQRKKKKQDAAVKVQGLFRQREARREIALLKERQTKAEQMIEQFKSACVRECE